MKSSPLSRLRYHKMKRPPLTKSELTANALSFLCAAFDDSDFVRSWSFAPCNRCAESLVSVSLRRNGSLLFTFCPSCNSLSVNLSNPVFPPAGSLYFTTQIPTTYPSKSPLLRDLTGFLQSLCNPPSSSSVP